MKETSKLSRLFKFLWIVKDVPVCDEWDTLLGKLMQRGNVTAIDQYTITFDEKYTVWIGNHPFSSGNLYAFKGKRYNIKERHCTLSTKILLEDFVNSYILLKKKEKDEKDIVLQEIKKDLAS